MLTPLANAEGGYLAKLAHPPSGGIESTEFSSHHEYDAKTAFVDFWIKSLPLQPKLTEEVEH
jgi:hypothetical protein